MTDTHAPAERPTVKRNRRSGIEDLWFRRDGNKSTKHGVAKRWQARFVDYDGRERMRSFVDKSDAQSYLDANTADLVTGRYVGKAAQTRTVGSVAGQWLAGKASEVSEGSLSPKTLAGYQSLLDGLVLPTWADTALAEVSNGGVRAWVISLGQGTHAVGEYDGQGRKMVARKLSASRTIQAFQVLKQILDEAVRQRLLPVNPAVGVKLPQKDEAEKRYLTHEQVDALASACEHYSTLVYVLGYCGIRFGEAVGLKVSDVDLSRGRLTVRRSVTYVTGSGLVEGKPKNGKSREVPLLPFVIDLLRVAVAGRRKTDLVFAGKSGQWLTSGEFRWAFDPAAKRAGVEGLVPHELRHTAASLAIQSGANIKLVQRMLGHKTATLTLDRYGHLYDDELDSLASRMGDARTAALTPASLPLDVGKLASSLDLSAEQLSRLGDLLAG